MGRARSGWPFASSPGLREIPHGLWDFTYRLVRYVDIGSECDAKSLNKHMLIFWHGHCLSMLNACLGRLNIHPWLLHQ